ncbi:MAG: NAD-dependent epimerase/dehydratase family protein [Bdellovibrionales bacterium]|nr:NAD-dependent epimerase/dehydratase family protein [Bdellovibrionales bacterium]
MYIWETTVKILVTGATGFIGGWLCQRLIKEKHQVSIFVRNKYELGDLKDLSIPAYQGDICDVDQLTAALEGKDAIFHLAGVIGYSSEMRPLMERVNTYGTRQVLKACEIANVKKMLYMSSVVAIGANHTKNVLNEESSYDIHDLDLGYFETKRKAEELVLQAFRDKKVEPIIVNPSTTYGARDALKGSRKTQVKVAQGKFPFYPPGGVNVLAIEDLIEGVMLAWNKGIPGERYILAGENLTIRQLFHLIAKEAHTSPPSIYLPRCLLLVIGKVGDSLRPFGIQSPISYENAVTATMYHWFDSTKAKQQLGFSPRPAKLAIKESVQWMREQNMIQS